MWWLLQCWHEPDTCALAKGSHQSKEDDKHSIPYLAPRQHLNGNNYIIFWKFSLLFLEEGLDYFWLFLWWISNGFHCQKYAKVAAWLMLPLHIALHCVSSSPYKLFQKKKVFLVANSESSISGGSSLTQSHLTTSKDQIFVDTQNFGHKEVSNLVLSTKIFR